MFTRVCVILALLASTLGCTMWKKPGSGWSGTTGGENLEKLFWHEVQAKNWTEVDRHVSATFLGAGPGGTLDRAAFLRSVQGYQLTGVSLADCVSQLNGADFVIACVVRREAAAGQTGPAATVSVWQQLSKGWVMVTHSESPLSGEQAVRK